MYPHEEASGFFSLDFSTTHLIGWGCIALGLFFAFVAIYLVWTNPPDPFKTGWWKRQLAREAHEGSKTPFSDLLEQDQNDYMDSEHPSAPLPVVRDDKPIRTFLEKADKEWEEFKATWDSDHSVTLIEE